LLAAAVVVVLILIFVLFKTSPSDQGAQSSITRNSDLNVLLITLDTTRADRLGCYGYSGAKTPNLDFLALNGIRFANAYCQVPLTLPSHCSIMTGTYPTYHNVHNNGTYSLGLDQFTLAEVLQSKNFQTAAFLASFSVDSRFESRRCLFPVFKLAGRSWLSTIFRLDSFFRPSPPLHPSGFLRKGVCRFSL